MTKDMEPVYKDIRNDIIVMNLVPGTQIREVELSKKYHVSRTPMRDVLKKLENDKLIDVYSQHGTYVTKIQLEDIQDLMYIRSVIEFSVMEDLFDKVNDEEISHLNDLINESEMLIKNNTYAHDKEFASSFFKLDNSFHRVIFGMDDKERVLDVMNDSFPSFSRYRFLTFYRDDEYLNNLFAIHKELIKCLQEKDPVHLKDVVKRHNYSGLDGIDKVKTRHPQFFAK